MDIEYFVMYLETETQLKVVESRHFGEQNIPEQLFPTPFSLARNIPQCNSFDYKASGNRRFFSSLVMATRVLELSPG